MRLPIYYADAFADRVFTGNPAAVCPLERWLPPDVMQSIAAESGLAETAFYVEEGPAFPIRLFTRAVELASGGHATLAAAHVAFQRRGNGLACLAFSSCQGVLLARQEDGLVTVDFPADRITEAVPPPALVEAMDSAPRETWKGRCDYMLVYDTELEVAMVDPDLLRLSEVPGRGVIVTAPGDRVHFVSRWFGPRVGIPEDSVTASAHATMAPYWAREIGKTELSAVQLSRRGGGVRCRVAGDRVNIGGRVTSYLQGTITV